jgi:hypothetical protein
LFLAQETARIEHLNRIPKLVKFDETLPNFINRKHPRTGEKKKQRARIKVQAGKRAPKR